MASPSAREAAIGTRREAELLLCCARTFLDAGISGCVRNLLRRDLDWDFVVASALKHGVATLLYRNLCTLNSEAVPAHVLNTLGNWFREMTERNELLVAELAELLHALRAHGIGAIPFKGPVLAIGAYGNLSLRTFSDLDLMIQRRDIPAACEVLLSRGYRLKSGQDAGPVDDSRPYQQLMRSDGNVHVDLQSSIEDVNFNFLLDREEWLQQCEALTYRHFSFPTMAADATLLILCVHGSKHLWERLIWISDVAELIRSHPELDWERLERRAGLLRRRRMLDLGLHMAGELLEEKCARDALDRLGADWDVQSLATRLAGRIFRETTARTGPAARAAFYIGMEDRWLDRARYAVRVSIELNPGREIWTALPPHMVILCYVMRSLRLLGRYVIRAERFVRMKRTLLRWIERTR